MAGSVIVAMANEAYFPQAKSLLTSCVRQGNWQGDFCLLCTQKDNPSDFLARGVHVVQAPDDPWTMLVKFRIFSDDFKAWDRVLYLDCDCIVQRDLNDACAELADKSRDVILMDGGSDGDGTIVHNWEHFDSLYGEGPAAHPEVYDRMRLAYPFIDDNVLTADVVFFDPAIVPPGTVEQLYGIAAEFREANRGNIDQQVINLVLHDKISSIGKGFCSWFAFDEPANRTPGDFPAVIHYWDMYAPWLVKHEGAGGHTNHRLGRVCHELYAENLAAFEPTFPVEE